MYFMFAGTECYAWEPWILLYTFIDNIFYVYHIVFCAFLTLIFTSVHSCTTSCFSDGLCYFINFRSVSSQYERDVSSHEVVQQRLTLNYVARREVR